MHFAPALVLGRHILLAQHKDSASDPVDLEVAYKFDVLGNRSEQSIDADGADSISL